MLLPFWKGCSELCFEPEPLFSLLVLRFQVPGGPGPGFHLTGLLSHRRFTDKELAYHRRGCPDNAWGGHWATGPGLVSLRSLLPVVSTGEFFWLEPKNAFENFQEPDIGLVALAFLQGSFAYGGWNFLNYVTEELVDPYKWVKRG